MLACFIVDVNFVHLTKFLLNVSNSILYSDTWIPDEHSVPQESST